MPNGVPSDASSLVRRLTLPKTLLREARVALSYHGPYSAGMATSLLQDSVESFLRIVVEFAGVDVKDTAPFGDLVRKIGEKYEIVVEHKAAISRLNRARVAFKHHGLKVSKEDAVGFVTAVDALLVEVSNNIWHIDFRSVSLISQIGHRRTENWLHRADELAKTGDYVGSISCASKAMAIYWSYCSRWTDPWRGSLLHLYDDMELGVSTNLFSLVEEIESIRMHLDLMMQGVDIVDYRRFRELTPTVFISDKNTIVMTDERSFGEDRNRSKDNAYFCIDFVIESALIILSNRSRRSRYDYSEERLTRAVVEHECVLVVHPSEDPPEVIRVVSVGETLSVIRVPCESHPDYAEVLQDEDTSYVRNSCISVAATGQAVSDHTIQGSEPSMHDSENV